MASIKLRMLMVWAVIAVLAAIAYSETNVVTLVWDMPTNGPAWVRSNLYVGTKTRVYSTCIPVYTNQFEAVIPLGQTFFTVTAVGPFGDESPFSNELMIDRARPYSPYMSSYVLKVKQ
jgi:hypothetical protein